MTIRSKPTRITAYRCPRCKAMFAFEEQARECCNCPRGGCKNLKAEYGSLCDSHLVLDAIIRAEDDLSRARDKMKQAREQAAKIQKVAVVRGDKYGVSRWVLEPLKGPRKKKTGPT